MQFKCEINMDNASFDNGLHHLELSILLNKMARQFYELEPKELYKIIRDTNGQKVGHWKIKV